MINLTLDTIQAFINSNDAIIIRGDHAVTEFIKIGGIWERINHTKDEHWEVEEAQVIRALAMAVKYGFTVCVEEWPEEETKPVNTVVLTNGIRKTVYSVYPEYAIVLGEGYLNPVKISIPDMEKSIRDHKVMGHYLLKA